MSINSDPTYRLRCDLDEPLTKLAQARDCLFLLSEAGSMDTCATNSIVLAAEAVADALKAIDETLAASRAGEPAPVTQVTTDDFTAEDAAKVTQRRLAAIGAARAVYEFSDKLNEDRDHIRRSKAFITTLINGGDQSNWDAVAKALELAEETLGQADMHIGWLQDVASEECQEAAGEQEGA
jgi:hypothetical protein